LSKGKYEGVGVVCAPPVPPPVRFAPFGPIGRELSVNAHELSVHRHCPLIGSQNGVEQFAGKRERNGWPLTVAWGGLGSAVVGGVSGHP